MFISTSQLKKLMSADYKARGIRIGHKEEGYVILGNTWGIWIDADHIPNKVKALIMEFSGILPSVDTVFIVSKEKPLPQYEFDFNTDYFYLNERCFDAKNPVTMTNVLLDKKYNVFNLLQINKTQSLKLLSKSLYDLIDLSELDLEIENTPSGPCTYDGATFFWNNATCTLLLLGTQASDDDKVIQTLSEIDFEKEMNK